MNHDFDAGENTAPSERLSQNSQMLGWVVFGGLVLIGFFFGIVTGYDSPKSPKPAAVAKAPKDNPNPPDAPAPKTEPQPTPQPNPHVVPREDLTPKNDPPKVDPPKVEPPKIVPPPPKKEEPKKVELMAVSFQKEVAPILRAHCLNCHGAGTGKPKGDVNLTSIANMMRSRGKILVRGKPEESDIYTSITEREMPDGGRPKPTQKELTTLRNWILTGAKERRRTVRKRQAPSRSRG